MNAATPGSSPYLCDWDHGAGGWESKKTAIASKSAAKTESQQDEEKEKREEEVRMSLTLRNTVPIPARGILRRQLLQQATLVPLLPPSHSSGEAATWATTLAPSQAGATQEWQVSRNFSWRFSLRIIFPFAEILARVRAEEQVSVWSGPKVRRWASTVCLPSCIALPF